MPSLRHFTLLKKGVGADPNQKTAPRSHGLGWGEGGLETVQWVPAGSPAPRAAPNLAPYEGEGTGWPSAPQPPAPALLLPLARIPPGSLHFTKPGFLEGVGLSCSSHHLSSPAVAPGQPRHLGKEQRPLQGTPPNCLLEARTYEDTRPPPSYHPIL